ncbi:MAG: hypothetical protein ACLQNE_16720 [Thermoguttaceae bacterium]
MKVCSIVVAVLFVAAARVQAAPLDLRQVPASAQWVAHVDVDTMRGPEVFEKAYAAVTERWGRAGTALQSLRDEFGLDLAIGLHSVTLYGKQFGKPTGVLIANVDVDRGALEGKMKEASGYKTEPHGSHTLHSWADEHGPLTGVFYSSTVLVFGRSAADVAGAVDVLDGKSPNLAGKDSPLAAKVPAGATFVGRAVGLAGADLPWKSPLLKQSESVTTALTVSDDTVGCEVRLVTKSAEAAPLLKDVINGAIAMVTLQAGSDPGLTKLFDARKIDVADKTVTLTWRAPVADVWSQAERAFEQWERKSR